MKPNISNISTLLFAVLLWTACTDVVELDLPDTPPRLVVDATITSLPDTQTVRLTYTSNYFSNADALPARGALVVITDDTGQADTLIESNTDGVYQTARLKEVGRTYTLSIATPDGKTYISEPELMREEVPIDSIYWEFEPNAEFEDDSIPPGGYNILIVTTEPAGRGDFYRWRNYFDGVQLNEAFDLQFANDDFADGNTTTGFYINADLVPPGTHFRVEQMRISEGYYDFLSILISQTAFIGGPFDPPPAPIPSNVRCVSHPDEAVYGFFACAGTSEAEITVPE